MAPGRGDQDAKKANEDGRKISSPLPFLLLLLLVGFIIADKCGLFAQAPVVEQPSGGHQVEAAAAVQYNRAHKSYSSEYAAQVPATQTPKVSKQLHSLSASSLASLSSDSVEEKAPPRRASAAGPNGAQHNAMLFLFNGIMVGTFITHLKTRFHALPETVAIFILGAVYSAFFAEEGFNLKDKLGVLGKSYNMWMQIDPHLLIFVMLPPLLAGDAMAMDTAIARKVSKQWMYLAGPGVLINGFLTALFLWLYLPYDWPFLLCLVTGAILCATDPVAVVALLKELGAPPALTVQIQGESLLNDGTAIVLYQLSYNMLAGKNYEVSDVIVFLVKTAACAWGLGLLIGYCFYLWICTASNKLEHHNTIIQIALTLCCAYWSFMIAEGVFHISGVLATVGASLVLADKMWPVVVCKESMHTVWHMFEYLGNVVVFFLAGALTAKVMVTMSSRDFLDLLVIYLVLTLIRGSMLLASRPIMNYFGKKVNPPQIVSVADALVMTWGGLRGAVGLALAIQVGVERADGAITEKQANLCLFYVSGVAALTLLVNATTAPALVKILGITQMPETKKRVLLMIQEQLMQLLIRRPSRVSTSSYTEASIKRVESALNKMEKWIERQSARPSARGSLDSATPTVASTRSRMYSSYASRKRTLIQASSRASTIIVEGIKRLTHRRMTDLKNFQEILEILHEVKLKFSNINSAELRLLGELPDLPTDEQEAEVIKVIAHETVMDKQMVRAMHEVFLNLMYANYWHLIDAGEVVPGTNEADVVLTSIKLALGSTSLMLTDFENILLIISERVQHKNARNERQSLVRASTVGSKSTDFFSAESEAGTEAGTVRFAPGTMKNKTGSMVFQDNVTRLVDSTWFNTVCMVLIMSNAFFIALEDNYQNETNKADKAWLIADVIFTSFFFVEFVMKFLSLGFPYFRDWWNVGDFLLVILSITGVVLHFIAAQDKEIGAAGAADLSAEGRLVRLARVFRVMRLMRLFRLVGLFRLLKAKLTHMEFSKHVAEQMQILAILTCFIKAHMKSQKEIYYYFGNGNSIDVPELARCVLESQVETYRALSMAVDSVQKLDEGMLMEVNNQKKSKALVEELEHLVQHAHLHHVITAQEAESVLEPVRHHLRHMQARIWEMHFGYVKRDGTRSAKSTPRSTTQTPRVSDNREECWANNGKQRGSEDGLAPLLVSAHDAPPMFTDSLKNPNMRSSMESEDTKKNLMKAAHLKGGIPTESIFQDILPGTRISFESAGCESLMQSLRDHGAVDNDQHEAEVGLVSVADPGEASVLGRRQVSGTSSQGSPNPSNADTRGSSRRSAPKALGSLHSEGRQADALKSPEGVEVLDLSESEAHLPNTVRLPSGHANGGLKPLGVENGLAAIGDPPLLPLSADLFSKTKPLPIQSSNCEANGVTKSEESPEYTRSPLYCSEQVRTGTGDDREGVRSSVTDRQEARCTASMSLEVKRCTLSSLDPDARWRRKR